jgi:hypothetical protein
MPVTTRGACTSRLCYCADYEKQISDEKSKHLLATTAGAIVLWEALQDVHAQVDGAALDS